MNLYKSLREHAAGKKCSPETVMARAPALDEHTPVCQTHAQWGSNGSQHSGLGTNMEPQKLQRTRSRFRREESVSTCYGTIRELPGQRNKG